MPPTTLQWYIDEADTEPTSGSSTSHNATVRRNYDWMYHEAVEEGKI
ncbi:MAG: hypothetical protein Ct9H90mV1_0050 [Prasinovirus sp.]|nr:MAG: hypothetical protein Ct9H90mV1_0050 [Prasinovirus sp.]